MHLHRKPNHCIEWKGPAIGTAYWSVTEYDSDRAHGRAMTASERSWNALGWTGFAPSVEELPDEPTETIMGTFRICDWDVYDAQIGSRSASPSEDPQRAWRSGRP